MGTRRFTCTLASAFVLVIAAGCGNSSDPDSDAVAWTDQVCGALSGFARAATSQPQVGGADPVSTVRGLGDYFSATATALQGSISELDAVGPSPVEGGDEYVARLKGALTEIRTSFDTARGQLAGVDTSSVQAMSVALPAAVAPLQELRNLADPTDGLRATDELRAAADKAANCQQVRSTTSPTR
jgi:hypothetical protein